MKEKPLICIGVSGPAKSGKNTTSDIIAREILKQLDLVPTVMAFGDVLKDECAEILNLPREWFDNPDYKEDLRPFMQFWGDYRKNPKFGGSTDYWINKVMEGYAEKPDDVQALIISDVRYDFEAEWCQKYGKLGLSIDIIGQNFKTTPHSGHTSEKGVNPNYLDHSITNDHSRGTSLLEKRVGDFVRGFVLPRFQRSQAS